MAKDKRKLVEGQLPRCGLVEEMEGGLFLHRLRPDLEQVYVEVTSCCNLNCITCIRNNWSDPLGDMDPTLFYKLLEQLRAFPHLSQINFGGFGEPLYHPQILDMVRAAKAAGYRVKISSNGMLLDRAMAIGLVEARVNEIIISCDSLEFTEFARIRAGGSLEVVLENLLGLAQVKREYRRSLPWVGLELVLMKQNQHQLQYLPEFAQKVGASSVLVTNLLPYTADMAEEILYDEPREITISPNYWVSPNTDFVTRCSIDLPRMKWGALRRCRFIEKRSTTIAWDGHVSPCYPLMHSYTYYIFGREKQVQRYTVGNIGQQDLLEIWLSPEYVKFRNRVRLFQFPSCVDCDLNTTCDYAAANEDCWGSSPSCADCLWTQDIIRCP